MNNTNTAANTRITVLQGALKKLLFGTKWNTYDNLHHIVKIIHHVNKDDLVQALKNDLARIPDYMHGDFASVIKDLEGFSNYEIFTQLDELIFNNCLMPSDFSFYNYKILKKECRIDLIKYFDDSFRGDIVELYKIPFTTGSKTIIKTKTRLCKNNFYVSNNNADLTSECFSSFENALAFCLSEEHYKSISKLIS